MVAISVRSRRVTDLDQTDKIFNILIHRYANR